MALQWLPRATRIASLDTRKEDPCVLISTLASATRLPQEQHAIADAMFASSSAAISHTDSVKLTGRRCPRPND